jgi:hypothetical protein
MASMIGHANQLLERREVGIGRKLHLCPTQQTSRPAVHDKSISRLKKRTIKALDVKKERAVRNRGELKIGEERGGSKDKRMRENGQVRQVEQL